MPLSAKGRDIEAALVKEYGEAKGKSVLYAGKNAGKFTGIDSAAVSALCDSVERLGRRIDAYCGRQERADDHRVLGGVGFTPPSGGVR